MYSVEHNAQPDIFRNAFSGIWVEYVHTSDRRLRRYLPGHNAWARDGDLHRLPRSRCRRDPNRYHQRRFVEQYQRKSSLSSMKDADIQEIAEVFVDKRYAGKTIEEMEEEQNIKIFLVLRDDLSVLPQKNMVLKLNDIVIIRIENEA